MNGIQIEHVLNLIDDNIVRNRQQIRHEVLSYLEQHPDDIAKKLAEDGQILIPTSYGKIKLTTEDLKMVAA